MDKVNQGRVIYPPELPTEEQFSVWIGNYHGSNWIDTYIAKRDEKLARGESVVALEIIQDIERQTRAIDISKQGLRFKLG